MTQQSPNLARSRYNAAFTSSIFEPPPSQGQAAFVPAGKRRDQTTAEMFGNYDEKDLRAMPKTFVPKEDNITARRRKQQFLCSQVLPASNFPAPAPQAREQKPILGYVEDIDDESRVDTAMVRQQQLSSNMFGRLAPEVSAEQVHDRGNRLMPNDFVWHSHPEKPMSPSHKDIKTHADRAYEQKCSQVLEYQSPEVRNIHAEQKRQERREEQESDMKRRANVYYSDLFGRSAAYEDPEVLLSARSRPKSRAAHEDHLVVHQDWSDARTELLPGARRFGGEATPDVRKSEELHQARIFGDDEGRGFQGSGKVEAVTHDNSEKIKYKDGMKPQDLQQAHLRATIQPDDFYQVATNIKDWEVIELHLSGLPYDADDEKLRKLCSGFELQIVKCKADTDPVRNLCKGRAKVMVRYNPNRDGAELEALVQHLEAASLTVET